MPIPLTPRQAAKLIGQRSSSKYNAVRTEYNGVKYDSILEAKHAWELDMLLRSGKIASWTRQVPFVLHAQGGIAIGNYVADFVVTALDGSEEIHEVKGFETALWKWKKRHLEAEYGREIVVIK